MSGSTDQVILQLGDLHYPDFQSLKTDVDTHDKRVPSKVDGLLGLPVPHLIKSAIGEQLKAHPQAIVAICGDVTSRGDIDGFADGVSYLASTLRSGNFDVEQNADRVHVVPGNHDVDFAGSAPFVSFDDTERFAALNKLVVENGLGNTLAVDVRATKIDQGSASTTIVSFNTCRGTGAIRQRLSGSDDDALVKALTDELGPVKTSKIMDQLVEDPASYEILDIPSAHPDIFEYVGSKVNEWSVGKTQPVLIAHHALLPQHTPRLNPYTEMVNAGQLRKLTSQYDGTVIYLHGHIHRHEVEVVRFPEAGYNRGATRQVVAISAPELKNGFNKITVVSDPEGYPMGLRVERYRLGAGEQSVAVEPTFSEIFLSGRRAIDEERRALLSFLLAKNGATGDEILKHARSLGLSISGIEVEAFVTRMVWEGLITSHESSSLPFNLRGFRF